MAPDSRTPDALIGSLLSGTNNGAADVLLHALFDGYPVESLRPLILSDNDVAARAGAWIASELGVRARPLINEAPDMLASNNRYVRFFSLDVVLTCATAEDGPIVADAVQRATDPDPAVRWKAMQFICRATNEQLSSASASGQLPVTYTALLDPFLDPQLSDSQRIRFAERSVTYGDPLRRRLAVALAARNCSDSAFMKQLAGGPADDEISDFARSVLTHNASDRE